MTLKLFHCHESRSMRSLWLLHELGLNIDLVVLAFGPDLHNDDYLAHHPLGRVPCLVDGELTLFESGAIAEYLCETYDDGTLWREPGHPERPHWLQWLHYAETLCVHAANLTQQAIVIFDPALRSPTVRKLETRRLEKAITVLEKHLEYRDYLLSSGFSAVDIHVGYSLHVARLFTDLSAFPKAAAYYQRLANREAFKRSLPAPDAVNKIYHQDNYWLTN